MHLVWDIHICIVFNEKLVLKAVCCYLVIVWNIQQDFVIWYISHTSNYATHTLKMDSHCIAPCNDFSSVGMSENNLLFDIVFQKCMECFSQAVGTLLSCANCVEICILRNTALLVAKYWFLLQQANVLASITLAWVTSSCWCMPLYPYYVTREDTKMFQEDDLSASLEWSGVNLSFSSFIEINKFANSVRFNSTWWNSCIIMIT